MGSGPMTGGGRGWCRGGGAGRQGSGLGFRNRFGSWGRGRAARSWWAGAPADAASARDALAAEEAALEAELSQVRRRLEELRGAAGEDER